MLHTRQRIILMDLNVALSSNFHDMKNYGFEDFVKNHETYRSKTIDLLRPEFVVLITARDVKWGVHTLSRIWKTTQWTPNDALFNDTGLSGQNAPLIKKTQMLKKVYSRYGDNPKQYYAIESNKNTRDMYASLGIQAYDCDREDCWTTLPF